MASILFGSSLSVNYVHFKTKLTNCYCYVAGINHDCCVIEINLWFSWTALNGVFISLLLWLHTKLHLSGVVQDCVQNFMVFFLEISHRSLPTPWKRYSSSIWAALLWADRYRMLPSCSFYWLLAIHSKYSMFVSRLQMLFSHILHLESKCGYGAHYHLCVAQSLPEGLPQLQNPKVSSL